MSDPIEKRILLIEYPEEECAEVQEVRDVISTCARALQSTFKKYKVDTGRAIVTMDLLQSAKHTAVDALNLPKLI